MGSSVKSELQRQIMQTYPANLPPSDERQLADIVENLTIEGYVPRMIRFDDYRWTPEDGWQPTDS